MSAARTTPDARGIPFVRLLSVETRKLFDTRAAMVLTGLLLVLTVVAIAARGVVTGPTLHSLIATAGVGFATLLPVLAILSVTGEWRHRTVLATFTAEPRRVRVVAAKGVPPVGVAVAASLLAVLVAVPVTAAAEVLRGGPADWHVDPVALAGWTATNVAMVLIGLALGVLLLNAPAAIVVYLSSTMVWSLVARLGSVGATLAGWLDPNTTTAPLAAGAMTGGDAARLAVSLACWILLPLIAGTARIVRREAR